MRNSLGPTFDARFARTERLNPREVRVPLFLTPRFRRVPRRFQITNRRESQYIRQDTTASIDNAGLRPDGGRDGREKEDTSTDRKMRTLVFGTPLRHARSCRAAARRVASLSGRHNYRASCTPAECRGAEKTRVKLWGDPSYSFSGVPPTLRTVRGAGPKPGFSPRARARGGLARRGAEGWSRGAGAVSLSRKQPICCFRHRERAEKDENGGGPIN